MSNIWITSDTHFGHQKDFLWHPRGFSSIEEHDKTIINNINKCVKEDDILYLLGDLCLNDNDNGIKLLSQINCKHIYIALGNHDTNTRAALYQALPHVQDIQMGYRLKSGKWSFVLSHYPMLVGNFDNNKKIWSIHGHDHDTKHFHDYAPHCYSCCLDSTGLKPKNLEDIKKDIKDFCSLSGQK